MISGAIIQTLAYCDHFDYPLTAEELHSRLIKQKISPAQLRAHLAHLCAAKKLGVQSGYYYLPGRSHLVAQRRSRQLISSRKLTKLNALIPRLGQLPGILAIYLTGSLAMRNAVERDDLDLFIVTKNGRLWTTRLLLTLYVELLGLRRRPHSKRPANQLCLNLYLTPQAFTLPSPKRSLYTAYELIQAIPLYDPHQTRTALLASNPWIKNYLPNFHFLVFPPPPVQAADPPRRPNLLEKICYSLQLLYMHRKITHEYITRDSAFFHPHNPSPEVK